MSEQTTLIRKPAPVYGCWNVPRSEGYTTLVPDEGYVNSKASGTTAPIRVRVIEDVMSQECRYDQIKTDPRCQGCHKPDYHKNRRLLEGFSVVTTMHWMFVNRIDNPKFAYASPIKTQMSAVWDQKVPIQDANLQPALEYLKSICHKHSIDVTVYHRLVTSSTWKDMAEALGAAIASK